MGKMEKFIFGDAGVINLVSGMLFIFVAIGLIAFAYGGMMGKPSGDQIIINMTLEKYASTMLLIWLVILLFGIIGGFEIGRYVQTEFTKRRIAKTPSPPPPPEA